MNRIKIVVLMGVLYIGIMSGMHKVNSVDIIKNKNEIATPKKKRKIEKKSATLNDLIEAISMDSMDDSTEEERSSYGFGSDFDQINIRDGRDLAAYIYEKRKEFLRDSESKNKKKHKKMFLQSLQQHSFSELNPEGSESGDLVFASSELIKISSKALVDLLVHFDVLENIQRPGGEDFYMHFQEGLERIKKDNPGMYQDCARDIMKKMFGKHSSVVRDLKEREVSPRISDILSSGRMLTSHSSKIIPPLSQKTSSSSIKMIDGDDEEDNETIDMSIALQMMMQKLQDEKHKNQSNFSATSLVNMFHSIVEDQKNQQLADLFSRQKEHLQILQSMPHELMSDIFNRTQKVEQGNDTNWKTMLAGFIVSTLIQSGLNYLLTGSVCSSGNATGV